MGRSDRGHPREVGGSMKRLADRFAEQAASCNSLSELRALVEDACFELGFDHFALLHHASIERPTAGYLKLDNYPEPWVEELVQSNFAADDPVHLASRRANAAFRWADVGTLIRIGGRQQQIMARSRGFDLGTGFTVPANVPGEPSGSCSFALRSGRDLPERRLMCAELIGSHAFMTARRILRFPGTAERPHLSRREVQCLRLVAFGKTDWETAHILGINVETVRQYVKRARAAYDVATRTQLVVHALHDWWLRFEELLPIPPKG